MNSLDRKRKSRRVRAGMYERKRRERMNEWMRKTNTHAHTQRDRRSEWINKWLNEKEECCRRLLKRGLGVNLVKLIAIAYIIVADCTYSKIHIFLIVPGISVVKHLSDWTDLFIRWVIWYQVGKRKWEGNTKTWRSLMLKKVAYSILYHWS